MGATNKRAPTAARPVWAEKLDDREYKFVGEYLVDLNGTQAVLRCGFTDNVPSARVMAHNIVHRMNVALAIDVAMGEQAAGPRQWLVGKLSAIAEGNMSEFIEWDEKGLVKFKTASKDIPREVMALIKRIHHTKDGLRFELHDPLRAIELLGKVGSIALTREKLEVEGGLTLDMLIRESYEGKKGDKK